MNTMTSLPDSLLHRRHHFIDGQWLTQASDHIDLIDPYGGQVFGSAALGTATTVDRAVAAARHAFVGWAALDVARRVQYLQRWLEALAPQAEILAQLISREMGAPIAFARVAQVGGSLMAWQAFLPLAGRVQRVEQIANSVVVREAAGVAGLICAWNYPLFLAVGKVIPALLAGCTVVLKPSDRTPLSLYVMADAASAAELPPGVFNLVHGTGAEVGEAISSHPDIDVVSYTGSIAVGRRVMANASANIKRVALELGGKSAAIVLPGADLDMAVTRTVADCFMNAGQTCIAMTRLLVPRADMDRAADLAAKAAAAYRLGDPSQPDTTMGPMATAAHAQRVQDYIRSGLEQGARLVCGGVDAAPAGFVAPTVFADVDPHSRIAQEEIFGPVLSIIGYDDVEQAITIANGTVHGLNGGVYGADHAATLAVAARLRCGKVDINGGGFNINAPAGGYKQSGIGRERGPHALDEYLEIKSMQFGSVDDAREVAERLGVVTP